ncbi:MAG TPA: hypothetical protein VG498_24955 [Terriglobales bacterium]|nr:hypothetical protein [Terriglobales bacterium]
MKRFPIVLLVFAVSAAIMPASVADAKSECDCPKDDPATHGMVVTLIDKELSSAERPPASGLLGFPKTVTVCMFYDPTNKGYPQDLKLVVEGSIDGRTWFPANLAGRDVQASSANGCVQVAPTRFIRVGWPPAANINSPGPHVTAQVQVSY